MMSQGEYIKVTEAYNEDIDVIEAQIKAIKRGTAPWSEKRAAIKPLVAQWGKRAAAHHALFAEPLPPCSC